MNLQAKAEVCRLPFCSMVVPGMLMSTKMLLEVATCTSCTTIEEAKELESEEQNDKLLAPLKRMQDDVVRLQHELEEYRQEKGEMLKAALLIVEGSQSNVSWELETLTQRLADLKIERDEFKG
jgi:uncharacterized protein YlxW (UPF0749 family)